MYSSDVRLPSLTNRFYNLQRLVGNRNLIAASACLESKRCILSVMHFFTLSARKDIVKDNFKKDSETEPP
jgi:hypothetical protein